MPYALMQPYTRKDRWGGGVGGLDVVRSRPAYTPAQQGVLV